MSEPTPSEIDFSVSEALDALKAITHRDDEDINMESASGKASEPGGPAYVPGRREETPK